MLHVGSRDEPSVINVVLITVLLLAIALYVIISLGTGDWTWWNPRFSATPQTMVVYCYGQKIKVDPRSYPFKALTEAVNDTLSGRKRWDQLSLSQATYQDYQSDPSALVVELFYAEPLRVHSDYKFFSNVDDLIIPIDGHYASTNAVFGQNQGVPAAGSLHVESTETLREYLKNLNICPTAQQGN
jgi:hypothetical protein